MRRRGLLHGGKPIPMPKGEVGRIAAELVKRFSVCEPGKVTPRLVCTDTPIGRRDHRMAVCAIPTKTNNWLLKHELVFGGSYTVGKDADTGEEVTRKIRVKVNQDECGEPGRWAAEMRSVLRHELTHATDPFVAKRRAPPPNPGEVVKRAPIIDDLFLDPNICGYILDPAEVTARIAQVEEELLTSETRAVIRREARYGYPKRGNLWHVLHHSHTYARIRPCVELAPKVERRFQQLVARLWTSGKLGPSPR